MSTREIKLFTSNSMRGVMDDLAPQYEREHGWKISISYDPAKLMLQRIRGGEVADLAILGSGAIDELIGEGLIDAASRRVLASCGVGIAVRAGAAKPDISSAEALKRTLLGAKSIAYTVNGASGIHFSTVIERLGIAKEVQAKAARLNVGLVGEIVAKGEAELAVQQLPELAVVKGIDIVGPLPGELQKLSVGTAGVFSASKQPEAVLAFLQFLASPANARVLKAKGHEPAVNPA
jgi:molybdate transport system substrate-binding protein